ncbi:MAG: CpsD/CapB family tyrosine-protein kinase [Candidatus Omnitrophica bacterium]|nr:CpsD/CapB family tyrosine-protein kinase [Candidatus Omnitrophota bacterium]
MSKITKALEKAARERLQHQEEQPTTLAGPVVVPLSARTGVGEIVFAGAVRIDPHIVSAADANSPIAEQYRILRTNFQSLRLRPGPKVVVVTSALNDEGKSVTSVNLALSLARQEHLHVVLVDGDMRKSSIPRWLGLDRSRAGLSTALSREGELNGSVIRLHAPPLAVLPAGPAVEHPAELLESANMKRVLTTLKAQFDVILIDAPPVLPVADPGILAAQADGVLLVIRAGKTQRKTVQHAYGLLRKMNAKVLGCIMTHVEYDLPGYRRYHQYYQHERKQQEAKPPEAVELTDRAGSPS